MNISDIINSSGNGAVFFYNQKTNGEWYRPKIDSYTNPIIGGGGQFGDAVAIDATAFLVGIPNLNDAAGQAKAYFYQSSTSEVPASASLSRQSPDATPADNPSPSNATKEDDATSTHDTRQAPTAASMEISDECTLTYGVNGDALTITMELTCDGVDEWVGIGFSTDGKMQNGQAVLGIPGQSPLKYFLNGKSTAAVVEMPANKQTLIDASLDVGGTDERTKRLRRTVMKFTKIMKEDDEIEIKPGVEFYVLYARGMSSTLGYHADRSSTKITL